MLTTQLTSNEVLWNPANFRLTVFVSEEFSADLAIWWESVTSSAPEEIKEDRRVSRTIVFGQWENGELRLIAQPGRIDWVYEPKKELVSKVFPTLGNFERQLSIFQNAMFKWFQLPDCPSVTRLALGALLLQTVNTTIEAFMVLKPRIPNVTIDENNSSDLLYQINRPRPAKTDANVIINRLSKWSVLTLSQQLFSSEGVINTADIFAAALELDINTAPNPDLKLQSPDMHRFFDEMINLANEIASEGDIP